MKRSIFVGALASAGMLIGITGSPVAAAPPSAGGASDSAQFAGTVSDIVDPAAETGIPRRWMRPRTRRRVPPRRPTWQQARAA